MREGVKQRTYDEDKKQMGCVLMDGDEVDDTIREENNYKLTV